MARGKSSSTSWTGESPSGSSSRLASRQQSRKKGQTTWGQADVLKLQKLILWVTEEDALISFSKVTGGGALVIFIKDGKDSTKEYAASEEELDLLLDDLTDTYAPS